MMFFWGWMIIVWLVVIGLIVWAVIALTRRSGPPAGGGEGRSPLDIARERYARGEITRDEFERLKRDLQ